jgi:hypothetical protein
VRIDPSKNAPVQAVHVGREPGQVVATKNAVWVANEGDRTLTRYDPERDRAITVGGVRFEEGGAGLASDGRGGVWVTTGGPEVVHVNGDGQVVPEDSVRVPEGAATGIAVGDGSLWVTSPSDTSPSGRNTVTQISLKTRKPVKTWVVGDIPLFVAYGGGSAWVSNLHGNDVSVVTPGLPVRTISLAGRPLGLAFTGSDLWVGDYDNQKVSKIDAASLKPESILPIGLGYLGVAGDESNVWVTNRNDGTVTRIDPRPGHERVAATIKLGGCPQYVASGEVGVWVSVSSGQACY